MSGLRPFTQHPDRLRNPHEQARRLGSDALLAPLGDLDAAWLEDHLASCPVCAEEVEGFTADAALLHALRDVAAPVPRDLGARVSLALDEELRRATRGRDRRPAGRGPRRPAVRSVGRSAWTGGALAGLAVAALVAVLVLPLGLVPGTVAPTAPPASPLPGATPILVDTEPVAWVRRTSDGRYVISSTRVDRVCHAADAMSCGTIDGGAETLAALDVRPSSLLLPRAGGPAVVVGDGAVYAIAVSPPQPVTTPTPGSSSSPTNEPVQSPTAPGETATPPTDSPGPSVLPASPSPLPASPEPSPSAVSESPTPVLPTTEPTPPTSPDPGSSSSPEPATPLPTLPPATPAPTAAAALAIAEGVVLVGASPAYSLDGAWVAFSARPVDGSHGPDVYVWRVGDRRARAITSDHGSVFAGWIGDRVLASTARVAETPEVDPPDAVPPPDADPATVVARSYTIEPGRGAASWIPRDGIWLPVVDPTSRLAVYWTGSLAWDEVERAWLPAAGRLVAADWRTVLERGTDVDERPLPEDAAGAGTALFEVRFDPAGRRLGVWIADPDAPGAGRISLVAVTDDGQLGTVVLAGAAALRGFSLDADRLAWSTPPGRNGQGSMVAVYAWRGELAGQVYGIPDTGDEPVVIGH